MVRNFAEGTSVRCGSDELAVLHACTAARTPDEIACACPLIDQDHLPQVIDRLVRRSVLFDASRARSKAERAMRVLESWNPEAGLFHMASKHVWFGDPVSGQEAYVARVAGRRPPPHVKRHPGAKTVILPPQTSHGEFAETLLSRRTHRRFAPGSLAIDDLAQLLALTAGIRGWVKAIPSGRLALRTSPSGGARHPIDCYVCIRRVGSVPAGLYHYSADRHRLERVGRMAGTSSIQRYLPGQPWFEGAAAILFFVARFAKATYRYPYSRAYRAVLIEAGHLCQTFCLTATWLGLAPFCTIGIADEWVEHDLGLDGVSESVVYAAGVGLHSGLDQVMAPEGSRAATPVANSTFSGNSRPRGRRSR